MLTRPENEQRFLEALYGLGLQESPGNRKIDELIKNHELNKHNISPEIIEDVIIDNLKKLYKVPPYDESDTDISPDEMEPPPKSGMDGGALKFKNKRRKSKKKKKKSKKKKKKSKK